MATIFKLLAISWILLFRARVLVMLRRDTWDTESSYSNNDYAFNIAYRLSTITYGRYICIFQTTKMLRSYTFGWWLGSCYCRSCIVYFKERTKKLNSTVFFVARLFDDHLVWATDLKCLGIRWTEFRKDFVKFIRIRLWQWPFRLVDKCFISKEKVANIEYPKWWCGRNPFIFE